MTDLMTVPLMTALAASDTRPGVRAREAMLMLLHEVLARSRQREAEEAARRYRLVRDTTVANRTPRRRLLAAMFRRTARTRAAAARRGACTS